MGESKTRKCSSPCISVIIPVYNSAPVLARCVESVLAQTFTDFELILVNDGSTDASPEICRELAAGDSRIIVIDKPNGGVSSARNAALAVASGRYVAFCDSDDCAGNDWLSSLYEAAGDTGLVIAGYMIYKGGQSSGSCREAEKVSLEDIPGKTAGFDDMAGILETFLNARLLQFVWNKLFVRRVISSAGLAFDESSRVFEDEYFVLEYLKASPEVTYVQACEYRYFLPEEFYGKYDFGIDTFRKVTGMIEYLLSEGGSHPVRKIRLPSVVYWYKIALGRYASGHSFRQSREKIAYARKLAWRFSSGLFNHLTVKILPSRIIYLLLKRKKS